MEPESEDPRKRGGESRDGSPLDVLREEERKAYQELVARYEQGGTVAFSAAVDLTRRSGIYLKHKYIPGRDRFADGDWLVATELARLEQIAIHYSGRGRGKYVSQHARAEWLEIARRIARRAA